MGLTDRITEGLTLAKAKGCPIDAIWLHPTLNETINASTKAAWGAHVSVMRMQHPFEIKLECGWTDRKGNERTSITLQDVLYEEPPPPPPIDTRTMERSPIWGAF